MLCPQCQKSFDEGQICPECFEPLPGPTAEPLDDSEGAYQRLKQAAAPLRGQPVPVPLRVLPEAVRPAPAGPGRFWWVALGALAILVLAVLKFSPRSQSTAPPTPTVASIRALQAQKQHVEVVQQGKALLRAGSADPRAVRELVAQSAVSGGMWDEAVAQYQLLVKAAPQDAGYRTALSKARRILADRRLDSARQALAAGNVVKALDEGKQALALLKATQAGPQKLARAYAVLGQAAYLLGQLPAAKGYLSSALALEPGDASSRQTLTRVRSQLAPPPPPAPVADYVAPAPAPRAQSAAMRLPNEAYPTYPTYRPQTSDSYSDSDSSYSPSRRLRGRSESNSYSQPAYSQPVYRSSSSDSSDHAATPRRRPSPESYTGSTSRVGELRRGESLLHKYR